jgi:hypothetical protein
MKIKTIVGATVVVLFSLFAIAGFSQRSPAQTNSSNSQTTSPYMGPNGMMSGGVMNGGMMYGRMMNGRMRGWNMMENHYALRKLIGRLESDLSAADSQAASTAIKRKLQDAVSAVNQLKQEYSQSWAIMQNMRMYGNHCNWTDTPQKQN